MPITVEWDNPEKTIIRQTYTGSWTWDDLEKASDQVNALQDTVDHRVHLLADLRNGKTLPENPIKQAANVHRNHPNNGKVVIVGGNLVVRGLFRMIAKVYPVLGATLNFVDTFEEAYAIFKAE